MSGAVGAYIEKGSLTMFNGIPPVLAEDAVKPASGLEGLRRISYLLRHPSMWAPDFHWDFDLLLGDHEILETIFMPRSDPPTGQLMPMLVKRVINTCGTAGCALGVATIFWYGGKEPEDGSGNWRRLEELLGIPEDHFDMLFSNDEGHEHYGYGNLLAQDVTADMVADKIDAYVAAHS